MTDTLGRLRAQVLGHLNDDPGRPPLGGLGIFHCRRPQSLRNIPIHQPTMVLVTGGYKTLALGERRVEIGPGELLLLPGGCTIGVGNRPGDAGEQYLGLALAFPEPSVAQFRRSYGGALDDTTPHWCAPASPGVVAAMAQWVEWCLRYPIDETIARHRQVEMLLVLAQSGAAGNLLLGREASWRERVAQLVALDPARDWRAPEVCRRLGIGESTLRRRLQEERSSFREVLEESRMVTALALLQETFWPVGQVAEAVGYSSHSRFSERFKRRFGLSPTALKRSRESETEQTASA